MRFFTQNPPLDEEKLAMLRFNDMLQDNRAVPLETVNLLKGLNLNLLTYMRIIEALTNFLGTLKRNRVTDGSSLCPMVFLTKSKKGSRHIRKSLAYNEVKKIKQCNVRSVTTFFRLAGANVLGEALLAELLSC